MEMASPLEKLRLRELLANAKQCFTMALTSLAAACFYFIIFAEKALSNSAFILLLGFAFIAFFSGLRSLRDAAAMAQAQS